MYGDVIHPVLQEVRSRNGWCVYTVGGLLLLSINDNIMLAAAIITTLC